MNLSPHSRTMLVVDHAMSVRSALAHYLEAAGLGRVMQAGDLARAQQLLHTGTVDLVLCELARPSDGLALLESVRQHPSLAELPFVLMSSELSRTAVARALELGIADLLVKPFTGKRVIERVAATLDRLATRAIGGAVAPAHAGTEAPERATILVVDDTPDNLQLLAGLFRDRFKVKLAPSGEKALSICRSEAPPDLILLDVMMPGMDGFEVARQVREHHACTHTPIIFVTALTDDAARQKGLVLGAIDYVTKPIDPDLMTLRVNNLLQFVEHRKQMQADMDHLREIADLRREVARLRALTMPGG